MRFLLKTDYAQDLRLFPFGGERVLWAGLALYAALLLATALMAGPLSPAAHVLLALICAGLFAGAAHRRTRDGEGGGAVLWYGLLGIAALTAPLVIGAYFTSQFTFVFAYAIAGVGLVLLVGLAGQISLGHAAFMACGAYTAALLQAAGYGILVSFPAAVALSAALGVIIGLPALRMQGIYLAFATFAFAFIVEEILARWESLTSGNIGLLLDAPAASIGPWRFVFDTEASMYYLALGLLAGALICGLNIQRSATGRAFMAIRDSETAAMGAGVNLAFYKCAAFAMSAGFTGLAGALYGHLLSYISPEGFTILLSINLLVMLIVGGIGAMHGAVFGAAFLVVLPQLIAIARDQLPQALARQTGLEAAAFGVILVLVIIFEPAGLHGLWARVRAYFTLFPLFRKGSFKRRKTYMASERNR